MNEAEIKNRKRAKQRENSAPEDPNRREIGALRSLNLKWAKTRENTS